MKFALLILATLTLATAQIDINNIEPIDLFAQIPIHPKAKAFNSGRIVGGQEAARGQFPYQVALFIKSDNITYFCGGSIISEIWIVTAAHCAEVADSITVYLCAHNITDNEESRLEIEVPKRNLIIHDKWSARTLENDIALIELPEELEFNDCVQPIDLPKKSQVNEKFVDENVTASGWGKDSDKSTTVSPVLRYVNVPVISKMSCNSYFFGKIKDTHICISGTGGKSTCNGDSGGPLVLTEKDGSKILVGLTSFGISFGCEIGWPAAFTRVTSYLNWISENSGIPIRE